MKFLLKYNILLFYLIFIIFFFVGYNLSLEKTNLAGINKTLIVNLNSNDLFHILFNNYLIGIIILFGFLTLNLTNITLITFNGLLYGLAIKKYSLQYGLQTTLSAIIPHGIIEFISLALLFSCSIRINFDIYNYFNKTSNKLINIRIIRKILFCFLLLTVAGIIEVYLTPLILKI